jgi:DNA excision repair protein ERCC-2
VAPRFDPETLTIELGVADLLDTVLLRHLGFGSRGGYERMWLGQAIHSQYQEEAMAGDGSYRREVALLCGFEHRGWTVRLHGRADGLRRRDDGAVVVEEIKSVRRGASLSVAAREIYARQALLYAWMVSRGDPPPPTVRAELVLIEIGGSGVVREELEADFAALEAGVRRRLNSLLRGYEAARQAGFRRRAWGEALRFPHSGTRVGQDEIVAAVAGALERGEHLLLQAPTGVGKTAAALFPALRHALLHDQRLFVLTAKTLQQEMAMSVLRRLGGDGSGGGFRALRLRAKSKMCANDQILCHEEYCRFAKDYFAKLEASQLVARLSEQHTILEPDAIFAAARAEEVCPFEVSLDLAHRAQVVVCDYNYAFDPYVGLPAFAADADLSDAILVIDEAHNLVDRGRGYYSPELGAAPARAAAAAVGRGGEPVHRAAERLALRLAALIDQTVAGALEEMPPQTRAVEAPLPEDALWALRTEFDAVFVDYLEHQRQTKTFRPDDPFVGLYFTLLRFLNGLLVADHAFSRCVELGPNDDARLRVLCKDPSRFLGAVINRSHATIALSATLSPPEFYRDLLGFDRERTEFHSLANPFPAENRRLVVDSTVATTWHERSANTERIAARLSAFADAVPGNCLALFPSYEFLAAVADRLECRSKRILVQRRVDSDAEREAILATLRGALLGDVLLLAVAGGVFAEGVDYPGDVLKAVAVVGPCLPGVSLEQELLKAYYQERFERGFEYAFVVPGMTRVVQAAGRLIRSATDQGVIALFDRRFLQPPYRDHLPADWVPEAGAGGLVGDPASAAEAFFAALDRDATALAGPDRNPV